MKRTLLLCLVAWSVAACRAYAQDLNNDYPVDSLDILNAMHLNKITVFKFPVMSPKPGTQYYVNYIITMYQDGLLKKSISILDTVLAKLPAVVLQNPAYKAQAFRSWAVGDSSRLLRVYFTRTAPDQMGLGIGFDDDIKTIDIPIDTVKLGGSGARAMDYHGVAVGEPTPLAVYYMNAKTKELMECPGNAPADTIPKLYDYVVILSSELRSL